MKKFPIIAMVALLASALFMACPPAVDPDGGTSTDNAVLTSLSLTGGTLSPAFTTAGRTYAADVEAETTTISVGLPAGATATYNGGATSTITLGAVGTETEVTILVTAQNGTTTQTYTLTITRVAPGVVDAIWGFETRPAGIDADNTNQAVSALALAADSGSGATLSVTGTVKWNGGYLQADGGTSGASTYPTNARATFTLVLSEVADLSFQITGSGAVDLSRWAVLTGPDGTVISTKENLVSGTTETISVTDAAAGTYTLYIQKCRLLSVSTSNIEFVPATNSDTTYASLNLATVATVTSSAASVATGAANATGSVIEITSVSPGTAVLTCSDGANHSATINVSVDMTGAITIDSVTANPFNVDTDSTVANTVGVLGLEMDTFASSNTSVAIAALESGNVLITSVSAGTATINCSLSTNADTTDRPATIAVSVAADGTITVGTIVAYSAFSSKNDSTTANNLATLGLVASSVSSSNEDVATAALDAGNVSITSVAEGSVTVTCTDSNGKTASIAVVIANSGAITLGTITMYAVPAPEASVFTVTRASGAAVSDGQIAIDVAVTATDLEYKLSTDTVYTAVTATPVTGLATGTYNFRFASSASYNASAATDVTVHYVGEALEYKLTFDTETVVIKAAATATSNAFAGYFEFGAGYSVAAGTVGTYSAYFQTEGKTATTGTSARYIKFTPDVDSTVTVVAYLSSTQTTARSIGVGTTGVYADATTASLLSLTDTTQVTATSGTLTAGTTYYINASASVRILEVCLTPVE